MQSGEENIFNFLINSYEFLTFWILLTINLEKLLANKQEKWHEAVPLLDTIGWKAELGLWILVEIIEINEGS